MSDIATRGDLASALFNALGVEATSSGRFGDAGSLDAVTSTLADLGITAGIGNDQFGTAQTTTRGQAFTMIARALGLADQNTPIWEAAQALVNAGIVHGYGDERGLALNEPLQMNQLGMLMNRLGPELERQSSDPDGGTVGDDIERAADEARDESMMRRDPAYAAFMRAQGIRSSEIDEEIALRQELFNEDARRRSETYQRATETAMKGIGTDFENRGLFRSGTRMQRQADRREEIGYQQEQDNYSAQRALESSMRSLSQQQGALQRDTEQRRLQAAADGIVTDMNEYDNAG